MGGAMLSSWLRGGLCRNVYIIDPNGAPDDLSSNEHIHVIDYEGLKGIELDIVILAVKPQIMDTVCASLRGILSPDMFILSIAAGQNLSSLAAKFNGEDHPIIRAMPNTPASIGKGVSVCVANPLILDAHLAAATDLLGASGRVEWIDDEEKMDAVTALSGSGPAYVFHLIEVLAQAGADIGLDNDMAMRLARETVIGSAALAEEESALPASTLRENVTSPNGTTHAALETLMDGRIQEIYVQALRAAKTRSQELNSEN